MTQAERRIYLIEKLKEDMPLYSHIKIPCEEEEQKILLRSLMNVREPKDISEKFIKIQDEYIKEERKDEKIVTLSELECTERGIYLWQGDITLINTEAIVNAANSALLGCFIPCHRCIDNAIHTWAGVQLRIECRDIMKKQGHSEETGKAKITSAYNLPCKYVIHTVGPIVQGKLKEKDCEMLKSCYKSCLELARARNIKSIAFCCISTGEFHFPNERAAEIAVETVREFLKSNGYCIDVVFNVFKDVDYSIYKEILRAD